MYAERSELLRYLKTKTSKSDACVGTLPDSKPLVYAFIPYSAFEMDGQNRESNHVPVLSYTNTVITISVCSYSLLDTCNVSLTTK